MYALLFLLALALTGLTWSFPWYRDAFYSLFGDTMSGKEIHSLVYSIHVGSWGGITTRILTFLAALIGGTLPLTGYYIWLWRIEKNRKIK